jgi:hypothetical protein
LARRAPRPLAGRAECWLALAAACWLASPAHAQKGYQPPPNYAQYGKSDQAQGREILEQFRRQGIAEDYYLEFELRVLPRHGAGQVLRGCLWGSRNAGGPVSRVSVGTPNAGAVPQIRLLVQSGASPALWRWNEGSVGAPESLGVAALFEPVGGTDLTPFDLQMPFLYWPEFVYEGLVRMRGRPAHQFLLYPPAVVTERQPTLRGIRVYLDTQYAALVQAEFIGNEGRPLKTLSILDLKKIGDQWIVKSIDLRDETTRNKTRIIFTSAALHEQFAPWIFDPSRLSEPAPVPAAAELVTVTAP